MGRGKTQIIDDIINGFPKEINNYHEPFVGGGSVLIAFLTNVKDGKIKLSGKVYASDLNANLISFYKNIQSRHEEFIVELKKLCTEFGSIKGDEINRNAKSIGEALTSQESYYYWIRAKFNALSVEERITPRASAMLLFMNKTGFRGLYRRGRMVSMFHLEIIRIRQL